MKTPNPSPLFETIASLLKEPATGFRDGGPIDDALRLLREKAKGRHHVFQPEKNVTEHAFITQGKRHLALYKHRTRTADGRPCDRRSLTLYDLKAQKVFFSGHAEDLHQGMEMIVSMEQPGAREFIQERPAAFFTRYPQYTELFGPHTHTLLDFTKAEKIFLVSFAAAVGLGTFGWLRHYEKNKLDLHYFERQTYLPSVDSVSLEQRTQAAKQIRYPYPLPTIPSP